MSSTKTLDIIGIAREKRKTSVVGLHFEKIREELLGLGIDAQAGSYVKNFDDNSFTMRFLADVLEIETIVIVSTDGRSIGEFCPYRVYAKCVSGDFDTRIAISNGETLELAIENSKKKIVSKISEAESIICDLKRAGTVFGI
jgi:hypothetical protein